jgi:preprotein translocase subunit SecG
MHLPLTFTVLFLVLALVLFIITLNRKDAIKLDKTKRNSLKHSQNEKEDINIENFENNVLKSIQE